MGQEGTGVGMGGIICYVRADMAVQGAVGAAEAELSKNEGGLGWYDFRATMMHL